MVYSLKTIRKEFKDKGVFYTPLELAFKLKSYIDIETDEVYDPTCGDGSLLSVFEDDVKKYGQEIDESQLKIAQERLVNFEGFLGDTLENCATIIDQSDPKNPVKKFKCIVANPPFSIKWVGNSEDWTKKDMRFKDAPVIPPKSRADYAFILHILHFLAEDGIAVVLCFPGILYRGGAEYKIRKWIVEQNYIDKVISIPGDTFVDTKIATTILVLRKNKKTTDIEFNDTQTGQKYIASINEIEKEDYNLSPYRYIIDKETEKDQIDPFILQEQINHAHLQNLQRCLKSIELHCELTNQNLIENIEKFKKNVISIIDSFLSK